MRTTEHDRDWYRSHGVHLFCTCDECVDYRERWDDLEAAFASLADAVELTYAIYGTYPYESHQDSEWTLMRREASCVYACAKHIFAHGTRRP